MRLTAELLTRHVLSTRMTHSAIGSESWNVREMFTAPYPVVVFPPSLNALYFTLPRQSVHLNGHTHDLRQA
jgi:hypothetical protein